MKKEYISPKAKITGISIQEDILDPEAGLGTSSVKREDDPEPEED